MNLQSFMFQFVLFKNKKRYRDHLSDKIIPIENIGFDLHWRSAYPLCAITVTSSRKQKQSIVKKTNAVDE